MIKSFQATFTKQTKLTDDMSLFSFEIVNDTLEFLAGQYVIMMVKLANGEIVRRLYSISSESQNTKGFDLLVKLIPNGVASTYLGSLKVGETASFQGPAGVFTMKDSDSAKPKIFLATSSGIAPIYSMLRSKILSGVTAEKWYLFLGVRTAKDLHWVKEFEELKQKNPMFQYVFCLSRETELFHETMPHACVLGRIDSSFQKTILEAMKGNVQALNGFEYYICGSVDVVESLRQSLLTEGVEKKNIRFEKFV